MNKLKEKIQDLLVDIRYSANHIQDHIFECDDICDEYIQDILDDCVLLQELIDQTKTPTLEECIKEWEELGYRFYIKKPTTKWETLISIFYEDDSNDGIFIYNNKTYIRDTYSFTMQEHQLLTKTFKALGWFDEK